MKIIENNAHLRTNFLELAQDMSNDESRALIDYDETEKLENRLKKFCTKEYPFDKVALIFHRYSCVAYLSAEFMKNAKVFLDEKRKDYILLAFVHNGEFDCVSIVYSNIKSLSEKPMIKISVKDMVSFMEKDNFGYELKRYFLQHA